MEVGLLAGEIQKDYPELTPLAPIDMGETDEDSVSGENYKTLNYERIVAVQAAAIEALNAKVEALAAKLER